MPGVPQSEIEELALSGLCHGLTQDAAYDRFRQDFEGHLRATQVTVDEDLRLRDRMIAEEQAKVDNIFGAIETGEFSPPFVARLNKLQAELNQMKIQREAATPTPVELPDDMPSLYRAPVENLVGTRPCATAPPTRYVNSFWRSSSVHARVAATRSSWRVSCWRCSQKQSPPERRALDRTIVWLSWLRESGLHFGENGDLRAGIALSREPGGGAPRRPLPG